MKTVLKHKLYVGFRGFMMRIPSRLAAKGSKKGEKGAKENADRLSKEERRVHHFIVMKMAVVKDPITAEVIANELRGGNYLFMITGNCNSEIRTIVLPDV